MDEELRERLEYEEQFFGVSSQFFSDCFKKLILDEIEAKVTMLVENFRGKLINQTSNAEQFETAVEKMKDDLYEEYRNAVEESFPEIESKLATFFHIPPTVILKEDLPVRAGINGDLNVIKEEIENLKGTFLSLLYLKQEMLNEMEEAESAILFMEYLISGEKLNFSVLPVEDISALSKVNNDLVNRNN